MCNLLLGAWEERSVLARQEDGRWIGKVGHERAELCGEVRVKIWREKAGVDEVRMWVGCGGLSTEMGGWLICNSGEFVVFVC
jgi:hypothetical protein